MDICTLDKNMDYNDGSANLSLEWHEANDPPFVISGFPFFLQDKCYCRLPLDMQEELQAARPGLCELSRHTSGGQIRFCTNSPVIVLYAQLDAAPYMSHMAATGQCGFDCYMREKEGPFIFCGVTKFDAKKSSFSCTLFQSSSCMREFIIYFPLYIGVHKVCIGVSKGSIVEAPRPFVCEKKLLFYGTSITQGGCASRPGMSYPALIGRWLSAEAINWGFSGNGMADPVLAACVSRISNLGVLVVDVQANAGPEGILEKNLPLFLTQLRSRMPDLDVLILSGLPDPRELYDTDYAQQLKRWAAFEEYEVSQRQRAGDHAIYFLDGKTLWPETSDDYTVDTIHPTDLGFYTIAKALLPIIKSFIKDDTSPLTI